ITQGYVQAGIGSQMGYDLGVEVFDHLQRLSLSFHGRRRVGDLARRVTTDSGCIRGLVLGVCLPFLTSLSSLAAMFTVMWHLDPPLSVLALLAAPWMGLLIRFFSRPMTERSYEQQHLEGEVLALAEQTLTALPVVQAFGREEHEDERFCRLAQRTVQ